MAPLVELDGAADEASMMVGIGCACRLRPCDVELVQLQLEGKKHFYPNELAERLMRPGQTFTVEPILCQGSSRRMATRPLRPAGPGRTSASSAASPRRWPSMACLGPFAVWVLRCTLSECGWAWGWRRTQACTRAQSWSTMLTCGPGRESSPRHPRSR